VEGVRNRTRLKWLVIVVLCYAASYAIGHLRADSVREYLTSAQAYWSDDRAFITLTTATEVRTESLSGKGIRIVKGWLGVAPEQPDLRVGSAYVFTYQNGAWLEQMLTPQSSPQQFEIWPYNGHMFTWDQNQSVSVWNGQSLVEASPRLSLELRKAFPGDPNNYIPAGSGPSPRPYDIVQDPITLDEWYAYRELTDLPDGVSVAFLVGSELFEISTQYVPRKTGPAELGLTVAGGGSTLQLWRAQTVARTVSRSELARYLSGLPFDLAAVRSVLEQLSVRLGIGAVSLLLLCAFLLKPRLTVALPDEPSYADALLDDYPLLDRYEWVLFSARIEALGFLRLRDVKLANARQGGIARIFLHPHSHCFASLHQVFAPGAPPLGFHFTSYLHEDWSVSHGSTSPQPASAFTRTGHALGFSRPGMAADDLFAEHLDTRDQVARQLGVAVMEPDGFRTYEERSSQEARACRDLLRKRNPLVLALKARWARRRPVSHDWLGDYPQEVEARVGRNGFDGPTLGGSV